MKEKTTELSNLQHNTKTKKNIAAYHQVPYSISPPPRFLAPTGSIAIIIIIKS